MDAFQQSANKPVKKFHPFTKSMNGLLKYNNDDTSLYIIVDDPLDATIQLNADLSRIDMWASMWLVTFNPSKSESLIFPGK